MSQGTVMIQTQSRLHDKDFTIATPEEFVHRFGGTRVINKVTLLQHFVFPFRSTFFNVYLIYIYFILYI